MNAVDQEISLGVCALPRGITSSASFQSLFFSSSETSRVSCESPQQSSQEMIHPARQPYISTAFRKQKRHVLPKAAAAAGDQNCLPGKSIVIPMLISSSLISTENVFGSVLSIPIPVLCRRVFPRPFPGERSRPAAEAAHLYRRQQVGSKL